MNFFLFSQAETSLQKASVDASTRSKVLDKEIDTFEGSKLTDLKVRYSLLWGSSDYDVYRLKE